MNKGFITLHRKLLDWGWYHDILVRGVFIHLLLKANWKEAYFEKNLIPRGSYVTSRANLARENNLSEQQIRTILNKLKSTNEITIETSSKFTIISIVNYNYYQDEKDNKQEEQPANQPTSNQQSTNEQPTINHNITIKPLNNENKKNIYGEFKNVKLSNKEYEKLVSQFGELGTQERISNLDIYIGSKGAKYKSHYLTILQWAKKEQEQKTKGNWLS